MKALFCLWSSLNLWMHLLLSVIFVLFCLLARHVVLPRELAKQVPKSHLMSEDEWRRLGVQQSLGWVHYMIHEPGQYLV